MTIRLWSLPPVVILKEGGGEKKTEKIKREENRQRKSYIKGQHATLRGRTGEFQDLLT
jgi:hypothetical protein